MRQRAELAGSTSSRNEIETLCHETSQEVLLALSTNPHLQERDLLRLLARKDLAQEMVVELAQNSAARKSYPIQFAIVSHPRTPRQVSLRLMKFLYVFDLLRVAQTPGVPADVKKTAEEAVLQKMRGMPEGQRKTLARRGTGRMAANLIMSSNVELIRAALDNPFLDEGQMLKVLAQENLPQNAVEQISQHRRWAVRYQLRLALIRNPLTPLARVLAFLPDITVIDLRNICLDHRMTSQVRKYIEARCDARLNNPTRRSGG
jgi:hypothetical protein